MARRRGGGGRSGAADVWQSLFRLGVGAYWLYFASQKWPAPFGLPPHGIGWMHKLLVDSAQTNPVPGLGALLTQLGLPNWQLFATAQAGAQTTGGAGGHALAGGRGLPGDRGAARGPAGPRGLAGAGCAGAAAPAAGEQRAGAAARDGAAARAAAGRGPALGGRPDGAAGQRGGAGGLL